MQKPWSQMTADEKAEAKRAMFAPSVERSTLERERVESAFLETIETLDAGDVGEYRVSDVTGRWIRVSIDSAGRFFYHCSKRNGRMEYRLPVTRDQLDSLLLRESSVKYRTNRGGGSWMEYEIVAN